MPFYAPLNLAKFPVQAKIFSELMRVSRKTKATLGWLFHINGDR